jgi:hypothetical protein
VPTQAKIVEVIVKAEIPTSKKAKRYKKNVLKTVPEKPNAPRFIMSVMNKGIKVETTRRVAPAKYLPKNNLVLVIPRL